INLVDFESPETMSQAMVSGDIDLGWTSSGTVFAAIDAGAPVKAFLGHSRPDFAMIAKKGLDSCDDLDGQRLAVHSREGSTGTLTDSWLALECPDAKPQILIVPGSENRLAGMLTDQIDASPVDLFTSLQVLAEYPDQFHEIEGF